MLDPFEIPSLDFIYWKKISIHTALPLLAPLVRAAYLITCFIDHTPLVHSVPPRSI